MARFRHLRAADENGLHLQWFPGITRRENGSSWENHHAPIENGDLIELHGHHRPGRPSRWSYHILGPADREVRKNEVNTEEWTKPGVWSAHPVFPHGWAPWLGSGGQGDLRAEEEADPARRTVYTEGRQPTVFHDKVDAMRAAENHYFSLRRRGQAPASDIDYENLVNPRDDLGDDYGDIFGEGR